MISDGGVHFRGFQSQNEISTLLAIVSLFGFVEKLGFIAFNCLDLGNGGTVMHHGSIRS